MADSSILEQVRDHYAAVARGDRSAADNGARAVAAAFGYTPEELAALPEGANLGLSCGNPVATARLRPGEVVLDLGSGGGIDVLLASRKVGPQGKAIGIDMTPEMVDKARRNAAQFGGGTAPANVEFHLARIDQLPLPDASVDCVISNCVINLAPDKPAVFREVFRVLKPGGRAAISDIALKKPLPPEITADVLAYVGCVAGAVPIADYERMLREAGFAEVQVVDAAKDLNAYALAAGASCCAPAPAASSCCAPEPAAAVACCAPQPAEAAQPCCAPSEESLHDSLAGLLQRYDVNDYAASVQVYAIKR